jgi:cell division septation protein DedD
MPKVMHVATLVLATVMITACSREKIDWKSAESADTLEAYDHFLERHPDGDLATQARARVAQLNEERDWKRAAAADSADGYRQFLAQHESGKWAGEARIRIENFALDGTALGPAAPTAYAEPAAPAAASAAPSASPAPAAVATPTSHPAPSPVAAPATTPQFGIQLGAFRSQEAALNDWKRIQARFDPELHGLFAKAVPVQQASGQLYRLQAPVGEESRARAICASLAKQSQPCVVVLPQPH